jgi:hypothetical protein
MKVCTFWTVAWKKQLGSALRRNLDIIIIINRLMIFINGSFDSTDLLKSVYHLTFPGLTLTSAVKKPALIG